MQNTRKYWSKKTICCHILCSVILTMSLFIIYFSAFITDLLLVIAYRNVFSRKAGKIVAFYSAFFRKLSNYKVLQMYRLAKAAVYIS